MHDLGFNSSVGILLVHAWLSKRLCAMSGSFNSSVGILLVHAVFDDAIQLPRLGFQFLSRNSSRSRQRMTEPQTIYITCFNSSVGILLVHALEPLAVDRPVSEFQFLSRNSSRSRSWGPGITAVRGAVSIPQSEFFSFTRLRLTALLTIYPLFQFLSRNSSRSRYSMDGEWGVRCPVSIPQSEFFSFTLVFSRL